MALKGRGFSRAAEGTTKSWASAPEGPFPMARKPVMEQLLVNSSLNGYTAGPSL
jgi:hypothetical protein